MIDKNKNFWAILGISHFFTDAIASFVLVSLSLAFLEDNSSFKYWLFFYFVLYNIIAFWGQSIIWYFLDKIEKNKKSFNISKILILVSFWFYLLWLLVFILNKNNQVDSYYIFPVILIWLGSTFFHIWWWNISLLSEKKKATVLWLFASGWVVWLSFWYFLARYYYDYNFIFFIILFILWTIIYLWKNYKLENSLNQNKLLAKSYPLFKWTFKIYFILSLLFILAFRSAFWTNYQYLFFNEKMIIFYLAISAFLWKIIWWILEDYKPFKEKYFIITWIISVIFIIIYSFFYQNLFLVLAWIFWLTLFISPITIILNKILYRKKAIIISYSFWLSLILWYFLFLLFS